ADPCGERPRRSSRKLPVVYDEESDEFDEHDRKKRSDKFHEHNRRKRAAPGRSARRDDRKKRVAAKRTARRDVSKSTPTVVSEDADPVSKSTESQAWPDKYRPSKSRRFVGNQAAIFELRAWLSSWKDRHAQWTASRKSQQPQSDSEDSTEALSNCLLLTGPPGVGKTSAVYFLAEELGYKVLEVHASSERTGRKILSQLHEATQSHHVEGTKLPLGSLQACLAAAPTRSQPETPVRRRGRPPKHPKEGPLQKLFQQQASAKGLTQKASSEQTNSKGNSKVWPRTTITGYFAVKTEEKNVPEETAVPRESVVPKDSAKGTLLDYFGGSARKKESGPVTSSAELKQSRKSGSVSSGGTREDIAPPSAEGEDCDVVVVGVSTQTHKTAVEDKQKPTSARKLSSKLKDGDKADSLHPASDEGQATNLESKEVHENHATPARKKRRTKPPSPIKEQKVASNEATKSNLSYSSLSIILFDDVDTIFLQDDGFWSAVESVLSTTKKPVLFTATRDIWQVKSKLPSYCPIINFATPLCGEVVELLQEVCSLEGISKPSSVEMEFLVQYHHCDIRRCLSELHLRTVLHSEVLGMPKPAVLALEDLPLGDKLRDILQLDSCDKFVEAQLMFQELGLDLAYLSLPHLLPFPVVKAQRERPVADTCAEKEQCVSALDVSWLSDKESGEETEASPTCEETTETKLAVENSGPSARLYKPCLGCLADMFDSFSMVDCFTGCLGFGPTNVLPSDRIHAWQDGAASLVSEQTCSSAASESVAYFQACSAKLKAQQLQRLVKEAERGTLELSFVVTDLAQSLSNLYETAEHGRLSETNRRQIVECAVPASSVISSSAVLDFLSALRSICVLERRRMGSNRKRSRRFLHYLHSCSLFLSDSIVDFLCAGFS
ncbi:unnamed protein product, partial [Ixodes hexagonus]